MSPWSWNGTYAVMFNVHASTYSGHLSYAGVQDVSGVVRLSNFSYFNFS